MKKTVGALCAVVLCATGVFAVEEIKQPPLIEEKTQEKIVLGKNAIAEIRKEYREGLYDSFLKEMNASYEQVVDSKQILEFAKLREGNPLSPEMIHKIQKLQEERRERVLQVLGTENTHFAEKVKSAIPAKGLDTSDFFWMFHHMEPGTGKNADENRCIDLDLEYDYKVIHLTACEPEDMRAKYYALKMEQMDKLGVAAQSFQDAALKEKILALQEQFDERLAQNWDLTDLYALMREGHLDLSKTEGKVIAILQAHQSHLADMEKQD